jgi:hypothetical protein
MASRQHTLPRFYLQGFTDPDCPTYAWVIRRAEKPVWQKIGPANLAVEAGCYDFVDDAGAVRHDFDDILQEHEDILARIIRRKILRRRLLKMDERSHFACFVGLMLGRVPGQHSEVERLLRRVGQKRLDDLLRSFREDPAKFERSKAEYRQNAGKPGMHDLSVEDLERCQIVPSKGMTIGMSLSLGLRLAAFITQMGWTFLVSEPPDYFVTSDFPLNFVGPGASDRLVNLGSESVEASFPVSRTVALMATPREVGLRYRPASREQVAEINVRSVSRSTRFLVIAPRPEFPGWDIINEALRAEPTAML